MKLYQVRNESNYPASYEILNPQALFKTKLECKQYIYYLKTECMLEERFTINRIL
jgi:hypothetical protein